VLLDQHDELVPAEAGQGDFIFIPPWVPHHEINAARDQELEVVLGRSGQEPVVVNLDIPAAQAPETVRWIDDIHRTGRCEREFSARACGPRQGAEAGVRTRLAMLRPRALLIAASIFTFSLPSLTAAPAAADPQITGGNEATYATALRTINPKLPLDKAHAYARSVMADAWRTHLDPRFIMSIVTVESNWRANAVSHSGARGLGQLMPATAATLGVNAWSASDNLRGTSRYLKPLIDHFAGRPNAMKPAIAGYNAGPKAGERLHGVPQ